MLSRKDYIALADVIRECQDVDSDGKSSNMDWVCCSRSIALRIVDFCEKDNPRFDRDKFMVACGQGK